jgi:hypothetical protein
VERGQRAPPGGQAVLLLPLLLLGMGVVGVCRPAAAQHVQLPACAVSPRPVGQVLCLSPSWGGAACLELPWLLWLVCCRIFFLLLLLQQLSAHPWVCAHCSTCSWSPNPWSHLALPRPHLLRLLQALACPLPRHLHLLWLHPDAALLQVRLQLLLLGLCADAPGPGFEHWAGALVPEGVAPAVGRCCRVVSWWLGRIGARRRLSQCP